MGAGDGEILSGAYGDYLAEAYGVAGKMGIGGYCGGGLGVLEVGLG